MTADELSAITTQLAAIEPPPEPDWGPSLIAMAIIAALFITTSVIAYIRYKRDQRLPQPNQLALKQLSTLQQQWQQGELNANAVAYQLATLLRLGLALKQLSQTPPPTLAEETQNWQDTLKRLNQLRYQADTSTTIDENLFLQIRTWLNKGATPC